MSNALYHFKMAEALMLDAHTSQVLLDEGPVPSTLEDANLFSIKTQEIGSRMVAASVHATLAQVAIQAEIWGSHMDKPNRADWERALRDPSNEFSNPARRLETEASSAFDII